MVPTRPTFQAIVDQACRATMAASCWLLVVEPGGLRVAATSGTTDGRRREGMLVEAGTAQRYTLSSGQPAALLPQLTPVPGGADGGDGARHRPGTPGSVLLAPCGADPVRAVLELTDKRGGEPFDLDDLQRASMLAAVAGAALSERGTAVTSQGPPVPGVLAQALEELARVDPERYRDTARIVAAILAAGP